MTNRSHHDSSGGDLPGDQAAIDAIARRAGAEVRRPAPEAFADGVRRARRRQQTIRTGLGAASVVALLTVGAVAMARNGDGDTLVPATVPVITVGEPTTEVTTPEVSTTVAPLAENSSPSAPVDTSSKSPPIIGDAGGAPEAIYTYADDTGDQQDLFDPVTLTLIDTIPFTQAPQDPSGDPTPDGASASGAITYDYPYDTATEPDACSQTETVAWVGGAEPSGLPAMIGDIAISRDGRVGVAVSSDCPTDRPLAADFYPEGSYPTTIWVFDPERPDVAATILLELDGGVEAVSTNSLSLSDDGTFLELNSFDRAAGVGERTDIVRFVDVATGEIAVDIVHGSSDLPRGDCELSFVDVQFVSSTAIGYTSICADQGIAVVIRDLVGGETIDVVNAAYADVSIDFPPGTVLTVDAVTFTGPASAWYVLCAERQTVLSDGSIQPGSPISHPCWVGHGSEAMREIPTNSAVVGASFEPLP